MYAASDGKPYSYQCGEDIEKDDRGVTRMSGTSMATPIAAGAAALIRQVGTVSRVFHTVALRFFGALVFSLCVFFLYSCVVQYFRTGRLGESQNAGWMFTSSSPAANAAFIPSSALLRSVLINGAQALTGKVGSKGEVRRVARLRSANLRRFWHKSQPDSRLLNMVWSTTVDRGGRR